jgi:hypothetical protein
MAEDQMPGRPSHLERREESRRKSGEIFRCAQHALNTSFLYEPSIRSLARLLP